jgi:phasin family protein
MKTTKEHFAKAAQASEASMETLLTVAQTAFASAERLASLNLSVARSLLDDSVANAKVMLAIKDVKDLMALQVTLAQPTLEKVAAYSRSVYENATETQGVLSKVAQAQVSDLQSSVAASLGTAGKSAPAGSDAALAAAKSLLAVINSSFEQMNKAAKQMGEVAQSNVSAATAATLKRVGAVAQGKRAA